MPRFAYSPYGCLLLSALVLLAAFPAAAVSYADVQVTLGGRDLALRLRTEAVQGVDHLSLPDLIDECGGYCQVQAARINADLNGRSIKLGINDTRAYTSQGQFLLDHPVIRHRGDVFVAVADVPKILGTGFGLTVREQAPAAPETPDPRESSGELVSELPLEEDTPPSLPIPTNPAGVEVIVIDPGHGGSDPGYVTRGGIVEKNLTLAVAESLREALKETSPYTAYMTRTEDKSVSPVDRTARVHEHNGSFVVSIHAGVSMSKQAEGPQVYYVPARPGPGSVRITWRDTGAARAAKNLAVAQAVDVALAEALGVASDGPRPAPVRLLEEAECPGIVVEVGHLTNPADAALLESRQHLAKVARAIAAGLVAGLGGEATP